MEFASVHRRMLLAASVKFWDEFDGDLACSGPTSSSSEDRASCRGVWGDVGGRIGHFYRGNRTGWQPIVYSKATARLLKAAWCLLRKSSNSMRSIKTAHSWPCAPQRDVFMGLTYLLHTQVYLLWSLSYLFHVCFSFGPLAVITCHYSFHCYEL